MTEDERGQTAPIERYKHVIWASLLGLTILVLVISSTRARAAKGAEEAANQAPALPADQLTPVPMSTEVTGAPTKPPPSFVSAFTSTVSRTALTSIEEGRIVARARLEIEQVTTYDNSWMQTNQYPMGDVPQNRGACTDVVVRSLREIGVDLQELVHDDIVKDMHAYGVTAVDNDIDHRRVSTMHTFFVRNAVSLTTDLHKKATWHPGDIVFYAYSFAKGAPAEHVAVISDKMGPRGLPFVIENGGPEPLEHDSLGLGRGKIIGHFRALKKK